MQLAQAVRRQLLSQQTFPEQACIDGHIALASCGGDKDCHGVLDYFFLALLDLVSIPNIEAWQKRLTRDTSFICSIDV